MEKFNYQIVFDFVGENENKIIFAGTTDLCLESLLHDCLDELKNSSLYDIVAVNYSPLKFEGNEQTKKG